MDERERKRHAQLVAAALDGLISGTGSARAQAAEQLLAFVQEGWARTIAKLLDSMTGAPSTLAHGLLDEDAGVRRASAAAIAAFDQQLSVASGYCFLAAVHRDAEMVRRLRRACEDTDAEVRRAGLWLLGSPSLQGIGETLTSALGDREEAVRDEAVRAIGRAHLVEAWAAVVAAMQDGSPAVRQSAAFVLGELRCTESVAALIHAIDDPVTNVSNWAVFSLGAIGDSAAYEALEWEVRRGRDQAALALGRLHDERALPVLLEILSGPDERLACDAALGLMHLAHPGAAGPLISVVKNQACGEGLRSVAVRALSCIDDPDANHFLDDALSREDQLALTVASGVPTAGNRWSTRARELLDEFYD